MYNLRLIQIFSASTKFGAEPNPRLMVDLAMPVPVLNEKAIEYAVRFGLSVGLPFVRVCQKKLFLSTYPKAIKSDNLPIVQVASDIILDENAENIRITRAHLEEDAGKSLR